MSESRFLSFVLILLKVLGLLLGLAMMVGFGFCSLCGASYLGSSNDWSVFWLVAAGLLLAALGFWIVLRMARSLNRRGQSPSPDEHKPWR